MWDCKKLDTDIFFLRNTIVCISFTHVQYETISEL